MSSPSDLNPEHLRELSLLRHEYGCTLFTTQDPERRLRLQRMLLELTARIERLQQQSTLR